MSNGTYKYDPPRPPLYDPVEELQLPNYNVGSLNTWPQTRIAYLHGELAMQRVNATLIRAGVNAEQRARRVFDLRNALRSWTRDLMHNRTDAEGLTLTSGTRRLPPYSRKKGRRYSLTMRPTN